MMTEGDPSSSAATYLHRTAAVAAAYNAALAAALSIGMTLLQAQHVAQETHHALCALQAWMPSLKPFAACVHGRRSSAATPTGTSTRGHQTPSLPRTPPPTEHAPHMDSFSWPEAPPIPASDGGHAADAFCSPLAVGTGTMVYHLQSDTESSSNPSRSRRRKRLPRKQRKKAGAATPPSPRQSDATSLATEENNADANDGKHYSSCEQLNACMPPQPEEQNADANDGKQNISCEPSDEENNVTISKHGSTADTAVSLTTCQTDDAHSLSLSCESLAADSCESHATDELAQTGVGTDPLTTSGGREVGGSGASLPTKKRIIDDKSLCVFAKIGSDAFEYFLEQDEATSDFILHTYASLVQRGLVKPNETNAQAINLHAMMLCIQSAAQKMLAA